MQDQKKRLSKDAHSPLSPEGKVLLEKFYMLVEYPRPSLQEVRLNQVEVESKGSVPSLYSLSKLCVVSSVEEDRDLRELPLPILIKTDLLYFTKYCEVILMHDSVRLRELSNVMKHLYEEHGVTHL